VSAQPGGNDRRRDPTTSFFSARGQEG